MRLTAVGRRLLPLSGLTMSRILGGLWVLDGLLQIQPGMFTMAMVQAVMSPAIQGNPRWVTAPITLVIEGFNRSLAAGNVSIAVIQISIGMCILLRPRLGWPYWLSLAWAAALWPFGQAYGGLLSSGGASVWTGAPGSAVLYGMLTWAAWPGAADPRARRAAVRIALGAIWAFAAVWQTAPTYFTASGLSGMATGNVPGQPMWVAAMLEGAGSVLATRPVLYNALSVALFAAVAVGIWTTPLRPAALATSMVLAAVFWAIGQGFGMLFMGMSTDPNTAPLFVPLALYVWPAVTQPRRAQEALAHAR